MSFIETIQSAIQDSGIKLLGQIQISEEEYAELLAYSKDRINNLQIRTTSPCDLYLSVFLVQVAIRRYTDGNYWEYFKEEINNPTLSSAKTNNIGRVFVATLKHYHLFQISRDKYANNAFVENIKAHAYVPNNYLDGYFDFIFAFYEKNLLRQLPDDITEDFIEMSYFFENSLSSSGDSVSLMSVDNRPSKSYRLLKATRSLFATGDVTAVSNILYDHLKMVDDYFDDKQPNDSNRFSVAFSKWIEKTNEIKEAKLKGDRKHSGVFYRKPYFTIDRGNGYASLVIPKQKIREDDLRGSVYALVSVNGKADTYTLNIYRAFGVYVTEEKRIPIDDVFAEYSVSIVSGKTRKFEIESKSYRIFDEDYYEISKLRKGQNYILVSKGSIIKGEKPVYINRDFDEWDEYSFGKINEKSVLYINECPISMTGSFTVGANFENLVEGVTFYSDNKPIKAAYNHPIVSFKVPSSLIGGTLIRCNNSKHFIEYVATSIVDLPDEVETKGVTIILEDILEDKEGMYLIELDEPGKSNKTICKYLLFKDFKCELDKKWYVFDDEAIIDLNSNYEIVPINCYKDSSTNRFIFDLHNQTGVAEFSIKLNNTQFLFNVEINTFKHGFEGALTPSKPDYLWHTDLKNDFNVLIPGASKAFLLYEKNNNIGINGRKKGVEENNGLFKFDLTDLNQEIHNNANGTNAIRFFFEADKKYLFELYDVLFHNKVIKANMIFDEESGVKVDVDYKGNYDLVIQIIDQNTNETIAEKTVNNGVNNFDDVSPDGIYTMKIFEREGDAFGFFAELKEICEPQYGLGIVNSKTISKCKVAINGVTNNDTVLDFDYNYSILHLEMIDEITFKGKLVEQEKKKDFLGPSRVVLDNVLVECTNEEGVLSVLSIKYEYDEDIFEPLYYDCNEHRLLDCDSLSSNDYSRYIPLFDDSTVYDTLIGRIV